MQTRPHETQQRWHPARLLSVLTALMACGCSLLLPASASATRNVTFAPSFSADSHLGEAGSWTSELTFAGSEYYGHVDPLTGLTIHLPAGIGLSDAGFGTCSRETIEQSGLQACPSDSFAGSAGPMTVLVSFGAETYEEDATVQPVFGPSEVLYVVLEGRSPVELEIIMEGHYISDSPPYGHALVLSIPIIQTVPGAPDASITAMTLNVGTTYEEAGAALHNVTLPSECPSGKFAWAADAAFNGDASEPVASTETACPNSGSRRATITSLSVSSPSPRRSETVTYTATVEGAHVSSPVPTGVVAFLDNGTAIPGCTTQPLTTGASSATATCQVSYGSYGAHTIEASYGGDSNYLGSDSGTDNVVLSAETETAHHEEVPSKGTTAGGSTGSSSSTGSSGGNVPTPTISSAQIAALLGKQLIPSGKSAKIDALLRGGGLTMNFTALEAGTLTVQWYEVPSGAKLAKKVKAKPVLVASGQASFAGAGTSTTKIRLTAAGRKLLKHALKVKMEVKGIFTPSGKPSVEVTHGLVVKRQS